MGARKPEASFFRHVLDSEGLAPHQALFVDDLEENVEAAERLGINAILYTCPDRLRAALAAPGLLGRGTRP